ncbi:TIGR03086 family protein [Epidermidibacterium keratini]|uniref:TIGR03086 family protein n=1 Tax=Epidermidibacterium keratini TaxID=1891644 RepID=A0A7L4YMH5_9ACTN|nr:TIGR03086 family metal-binding protein [Epidermidibacterium keratini]QHC00083.1 TIGR03086 family protein [Epidermidibacterium keratini]
MTTQTQQQMSAVLDQLAGVLDGIDDTSKPTPCTEYDVAALRAHTVGWLTAFTDGFEAADGQCSNPDAARVNGTGGDQVRQLADRLDQALSAGAAQRPLRIGDAEMPGDMSLQMMLWEYQMHGWDLARATGQQWSPPQDGVLASLEFAPAMLTEDYQGEGKSFGPRVEVPADAPAIDRLAGLSGRDPKWSA